METQEEENQTQNQSQSQQQKISTRVKTKVEVGDLMDEMTGLPRLKKLIDNFLVDQNTDPMKNIENLLDLYKAWARSVRPGIPFEEILSQFYRLGKNEIIVDWLRNNEGLERMEEEELNFEGENNEEVGTENIEEIEKDEEERNSQNEKIKEEKKEELDDIFDVDGDAKK
ncbi:hypothetical protein EIN_177770 [Entamoeba invadens IP1]|uniref:hypothetical protein n=1 Tax=Entamoeba invadens IP1 TaxID=370355 RepID=UPI0002C3E6F9|nr:hypothetical protein EIN_177770 [Entamoeba invadens IP1]ELP93880.1 hypothetical protein EIN_177770 [Entamoeba invadens IP1]|eukprot:XP_004260651.1 hypothetical protein EIN_177770 [Entamoeba invadens IP1]